MRNVIAALLIPFGILLVLLVLQIKLETLTVLKRKPADIASAHVAVGAPTLATMFILTVRAIRLFPVLKIKSTEQFAASPSSSTRKEDRFLAPS